MEELKEIKQLKRKEQILENISYYRKERLRRDAGPFMLVLAAVAGTFAAMLFAGIFRRNNS